MKLSTLIARLAEKTNTAQLRDAISRQRPLPDRCMIWTGAHTRFGRFMVKKKDLFGIQYVTPSALRPYGKIFFNGKLEIVHLLIYRLVYPDRPKTRLRQMCSTMLCVHPDHWIPYDAIPQLPDEPFPEDDGEWTIEEAQSLVDMVLAQGPLDLGHPLLEDIPPTLLTQVLSLDEYSSRRVLQRDCDRG